MEEEDERREAAIAIAAASLQSNYEPKGGGLTSARLSKFQELHTRRLQLKSRSKPKKKTKGLINETGKSTEKNIHAKECMDAGLSSRSEDSSSSLLKDVPYTQQEKGGENPVPKQRKKLHWGLDTKERWEMKANM